MDQPGQPHLRLSSPLGNVARCLLFSDGGRLLLLGDGNGKACLFDLKARRPLSLLSPSDGGCVSASSTGLPFGTHMLSFAGCKGNESSSSPLLHMEHLLDPNGGTSRVVLQQKDSRLSLFDLKSEKFVGSLTTGAFSFCKCTCPHQAPITTPEPRDRDSSNSSISNSSSSSSDSSIPHCLLGKECVAAPVSDLDAAGIFDMRGTSSVFRPQKVTAPALKLQLPVAEVQRVFRKKSSDAGSLQGLAFPSSSSAFHLLAAYELPSVALWDLRYNKTPLSFLALPEALSPPTELAAAGHRAWVGCVEGDLQIVRISKKKQEIHKQMEQENHDTGITNPSSNNNSNSSHESSSRGSASLHLVASVRLFGGGDGGKKVCVIPSSCRDAFVSFQELERDKLHITSLALRNDGLVGACGCSTGLVHLCEGKGLRYLGALAGHQTPVSSLAWCPTNGLLASGDKEGVVYLWDVYRDSYNNRSATY